MSARTLKTLLWKDWRLARSLLIATAALYFTPMVVGAIWLAIPSNQDHPRDFKEWLENAGIGLFLGLIVSTLATPMFGAVMFARERRDRTAELVGTMPVRRGPIVLSKSLVLFFLTALPWLVTTLGLLVLWLVIRYGLGLDHFENFQASSDPGPPSDWTGGMFLPGAVILAVGAGWMFSSFVSRDTIAAGLSFFCTVLTITMVFVVWFRLNPEDTGLPHQHLAVITGGGGIACFITGTIIALRRKTP